MDHRRIRDVAALDARTHAPRSGERQAERPYGRDPAPDRTQSAQRRRSQSARRAADHHRLRRIQADGGTRTASITSAWIALYDCLAWMKLRQMTDIEVLRDHVAAISCGVCSGVAVLDLDYAEDSQADTDANFVLTGSGNIVEVQATAEKIPFTETQFSALLSLARKGVAKLVDLQKMAVM